MLSTKFYNKVWNELLLTFSEFQNNLKPETFDDLLTCPLWFNDQIRIDRKPVYLKVLYGKGIKFISDIFDSIGNLLSYNDFCHTYNIQLPFLHYHGLITAVTSTWSVLRDPPKMFCYPLFHFISNCLGKMKKVPGHFIIF